MNQDNPVEYAAPQRMLAKAGLTAGQSPVVE